MKDFIKEFATFKMPKVEDKNVGNSINITQEDTSSITFDSMHKENIKKAVTDYIKEYASNNKVAPEYFWFLVTIADAEKLKLRCSDSYFRYAYNDVNISSMSLDFAPVVDIENKNNKIYVTIGVAMHANYCKFGTVTKPSPDNDNIDFGEMESSGELSKLENLPQEIRTYILESAGIDVSVKFKLINAYSFNGGCVFNEPLGDVYAYGNSECTNSTHFNHGSILYIDDTDKDLVNSWVSGKIRRTKISGFTVHASNINTIARVENFIYNYINNPEDVFGTRTCLMFHTKKLSDNVLNTTLPDRIPLQFKYVVIQSYKHDSLCANFIKHPVIFTFIRGKEYPVLVSKTTHLDEFIDKNAILYVYYYDYYNHNISYKMFTYDAYIASIDSNKEIKESSVESISKSPKSNIEWVDKIREKFLKIVRVLLCE